MSLLDEIVAATGPSGPRCSFPALLAGLEPAVAADLTAAIADRRYQISAILRAAAARGIDLSRSTVERHRLGQCKSCR